MLHCDSSIRGITWPCAGKGITKLCGFKSYINVNLHGDVGLQSHCLRSCFQRGAIHRANLRLASQNENEKHLFSWGKMKASSQPHMNVQRFNE